jgi:hypothetical protein
MDSVAQLVPAELRRGLAGFLVGGRSALPDCVPVSGGEAGPTEGGAVAGGGDEGAAVAAPAKVAGGDPLGGGDAVVVVVWTLELALSNMGRKRYVHPAMPAVENHPMKLGSLGESLFRRNGILGAGVIALGGAPNVYSSGCCWSRAGSGFSWTRPSTKASCWHLWFGCARATVASSELIASFRSE